MIISLAAQRAELFLSLDHVYFCIQWFTALIDIMDNSAYLVLITSFDPERKIGAIKRIREVTGFGLAKAKSLIENCPSEIMNGMYLNQAEELSDLLKEKGMAFDIQTDAVNIPKIKNLDQISFERYEDNDNS